MSMSHNIFEILEIGVIVGVVVGVGDFSTSRQKVNVLVLALGITLPSVWIIEVGPKPWYLTSADQILSGIISSSCEHKVGIRVLSMRIDCMSHHERTRDKLVMEEVRGD